MNNGKVVFFWFLQRVTALFMLPVPFLFVFKLSRVCNPLDAVMSVTSGYEGAIAVFFLLIASYHGMLGVQVVLEDYVHSEKLCHITIIALKTLCYLTVIAVLSVVAVRIFA